MKPILHLCLLSMLLSTCPTHGYAQRWLKPFHKTSKKVFPQQTLAASCVFPFTKQEIKNAARQAEQMWELQQINAALDKKFWQTGLCSKVCGYNPTRTTKRRSIWLLSATMRSACKLL